MTEREQELQRRIDKALALAAEWEAAGSPRELPVDFKLLNVASRLRAALAADAPTTATAGPKFCKCGHIPELHNGDQRGCRGIGPIGLGLGCDCSGRFQPPATAEGSDQ